MLLTCASCLHGWRALGFQAGERTSTICTSTPRVCEVSHAAMTCHTLQQRGCMHRVNKVHLQDSTSKPILHRHQKPANHAAASLWCSTFALVFHSVVQPSIDVSCYSTWIQTTPLSSTKVWAELVAFCWAHIEKYQPQESLIRGHHSFFPATDLTIVIQCGKLSLGEHPQQATHEPYSKRCLLRAATAATQLDFVKGASCMLA